MVPSYPFAQTGDAGPGGGELATVPPWFTSITGNW